MVNESSWGVAQILSEQAGRRRTHWISVNNKVTFFDPISYVIFLNRPDFGPCQVLHRKAGFCPPFSLTPRKGHIRAAFAPQVPGFVEAVLQSSHANEHGFDLRDAALMAGVAQRFWR